VSCWWWKAHGGNQVAERKPLSAASLACGRLVNRGNPDATKPAQGESDRIAAFGIVNRLGVLSLPHIGDTMQTANGWAVIDDYGDSRLISNPTVPGTNVQILGGLLAGPVATGLLWIASQWHRRVEPLSQDLGQWGYNKRTKRGSSDISEHSAGTAMDLNASRHPFQDNPANSLSNVQVLDIRNIEAETEGAFTWGGAWSDGMHWEANDFGAVKRFAAKIGGGVVIEPPDPSGDDEVTDDDINKIVDKVLHTAVTEGGPSLGRLIMQIEASVRDLQADTAKLLDPRNAK
jgi:hypothetical protein